LPMPLPPLPPLPPGSPPPAPASADAWSDADVKISPALREKCNELGELFGRRDWNSVVNRYDIGALVRDVQDDANGCYGCEGVKTLARELGRSESTLYEHSRVAEQWARAEVVNLMARRMKSGKKLVWGHWRALDRDDLISKEQRVWIERALTQGSGLNARQMTEAIDASLGIEPTALQRLLGRIIGFEREFTGIQQKLDAAAPLAVGDEAALAHAQIALDAIQRIRRSSERDAQTLREFLARHRERVASTDRPPPMEFCENSENLSAVG
jgi:hypothetical protein